MKPSKLRPFFAYLTDEQYASLKQFSGETGSSMTQLIRESVDARLSKGDQYVAGYNQAIEDGIPLWEDLWGSDHRGHLCTHEAQRWNWNKRSRCARASSE
jgi:hypothetical protein